MKGYGWVSLYIEQGIQTRRMVFGHPGIVQTRQTRESVR